MKMVDKKGVQLAINNFQLMEKVDLIKSTKSIDDSLSDAQSDSQLIFYVGIILSGTVVVFVFVVLVFVICKTKKRRPKRLKNPTLVSSNKSNINRKTLFGHFGSYKEKFRNGHKSTLEEFMDYEL